MNWIILFIGFGVLWTMGFILEDSSYMAVAFGLMWMALAVKAGG